MIRVYIPLQVQEQIPVTYQEEAEDTSSQYLIDNFAVTLKKKKKGKQMKIQLHTSSWGRTQ